MEHSNFIDLSHTLENGMPGFKMKDEDGNITQYTASIKPFLTHQESSHFYNDKAAFEITEMKLHTSIGTYLDSPYHRYPEMRDISELNLDELILPGIVIDVRNRQPNESIGIEALSDNSDLQGKAVLFNFGYDKYWGEEYYFSYPFIDRELVSVLIESRVKLVGVDTLNIDNTGDPERPAHSQFLKNDILIAENLTNLDLLHGNDFRFFAVPVKGRKVAAMPVRAFAEIMS